MELIIAVDPGLKRSALVEYEPITGCVANMMLDDNEVMREYLKETKDKVTFEYTPPYTLSTRNGHKYVPQEVVLTAIEIGRFIECCWGGHELLSRLEVKKHLLGRATGTDTDVRHALIDIFGGTRQEAVGTKNSPGPLYGFKADMWAALAVAITVAEGRERG